MMRDRFDMNRLLALWDDDADASIIAEVLGTTRHRVNDWRRHRGHMVEWWRADEYAIRVGTHPAMVWADWCELALAAPVQEELW